MSWMMVLKKDSKWNEKTLNAKRRQLLNKEPSLKVEFPEMSHPSNESEIPQVIEAIKNNKLDDKTQTDLDKNFNEKMLEIVGEDIKDWQQLIEDMNIMIIKLKMKYKRPRPYEVTDKIDSVTGTDDSPSFPSGHATESHAMAKILGNKYPDKQGELEDYANKVALHRMQIGSHYPSDIEAGKKAGQLIADAYLSTNKLEKWSDILSKKGDGFKREKDEGLHGWFSRRGGKESKDGKTQGGWIDCSTCGRKGGPKPCGRKDASKGKKRRCRPTCSACKTYKRRKGKR